MEKNLMNSDLIVGILLGVMVSAGMCWVFGEDEEKKTIEQQKKDVFKRKKRFS